MDITEDHLGGDVYKINLSGRMDVEGVGRIEVHLIRRFMDRCRYERRGGSNVLTLVADRARPGVAPLAGPPAAAGPPSDPD